MVDDLEPVVAVVIRVALPGQPAFQLRKGELGLSVFLPAGVEPPLTEDEILDAFRPGSLVLYRTLSQIESLGLQLVHTLGADTLPARLQTAHAEVRPGHAMTRSRFKEKLKDLE